MESILLSWSGGKDSCMALAKISENRAQPVAGLLSTVTEGFDRVGMHSVRLALLEQQAAALALRLVSNPPRRHERGYESRLAEALGSFQRQAISEWPSVICS